MQERQVNVQDMLLAREQRVQRQQTMLTNHSCALISFTMNIAGPVKTNAAIRDGFFLGCSQMNAQLRSAGLRTEEHRIFHEFTGEEAYWAVKTDALTLKRLTAELEDNTPVGRLFDLDVLDASGRHIGREELGIPPRRCLLCGRDAKVCARSRTHTVSELWEHSMRILQQDRNRRDCELASELAARSLLYEVCTTPKPGLVDRDNSGSHRDMDIFTFLKSTAALQPYFFRCAEVGRETADLPAVRTFRALRFHGRQAEASMNRVTGGVNTHKGAIFSVGLLCGALGRLSGEQWNDPEAVLSECAAMTEGLIASDFAGVTEETACTVGQKLYVTHGITGIRGQAEAGFPAVLEVGLPALREGLRRGLSLNDAGCGALLAIIASTTDTNLIARGGREEQIAVCESLADLLQRNPFPDRDTLRTLDRQFTEKNLSPGGSADLLAMTYFLYFLSGEVS